MAFILPELEYGYDALEPHIDASTMEIHHMKHHAAYLKKFNEAIENTELEKMKPSDIFAEISKHPDEVRNYGGGFFNHSLFWKILSPEPGEDIDVRLADAIAKYFGTIEKFRHEFSNVATTHFGSGWTWLIKKRDNELIITSSLNQDNPLMDTSPIRGMPILCLDLWEHAYYLKYQNKKNEYIDAFWNIVNWKKVSELYNSEFKLFNNNTIY